MIKLQTSSNQAFLCKSKEELIQEFTGIPNAIQPSAKPNLQKFATATNKEYYFSRNRYPEVLAQDDTRVVLPETPGNYINANYCFKGRVILTQGLMAPGQRNYYGHHLDFYHMLWAHNSTAIAMLTSYIENGDCKSSFYLPPNDETPLYIPPYTITAYSAKDIQDPALERCHIQTTEITIEREGKIKRVYHYHCTSWRNEQGVNEKIAAILVRTLLKHITPVLHCNDGIGRSGAAAAIMSAYLTTTEAKANHQDIPLSLIPNAVVNLRNERHGCVQTFQQYQTIYNTLKILLEEDASARLKISL